MEEKILSVLCSSLGLDKADTTISQTNCENWNSLRHLNLIVDLETEFDVEFEPEEIAAMKDYKSIRKMLESKLS